MKDIRFDGTPEGLYILSEWTEIFEGFFSHIPKDRWMNHPARNAAASHKISQLTTASDLGFRVPETLVTQSAEMARNFFYKNKGEVIVKPMARGYVERPENQNDSIIYTNRVLESHLDRLDDLSACPALFQHFVPKEFDVRITVVDSEIHAVSLKAKDTNGVQRCDIRRDNMSDVLYETMTLPDRVEQAVRHLMRLYELRFSAIDMAVTNDGEWYFLEINPNGQWAWLDLCAGQRIIESFAKAFSAHE